MAIDNSGLVYLFDSIFQIENLAGRPVCPGHIEVFVAGTDTKYITYQNFDGTRNPFKVPLNSDGRAVILVEAQFKYDVYIYDSFNNMICSRLNVAPAVGGDVSVSGLTEVYHDGTLDGEGTPWVPLTVSTSAIDEMVSGKADVSALSAYQEISGMTAYQPAGDYYSASNPSGFATTDYVDSGLSGKADSSALDGLMSASLLESTDGVITAYNGSAFAGGGGSTYSGIAPVIVDNENNTISVSAKEFVVNDPLQLVENPSAFELSLTGSLDNPRIRIVEYGVDDWDAVESAISDMSAGKIDYVVAKMVEGNDVVYAPLARVNSGEQAIFVSPANAQDTSYGMGTRRVTDVISISSGGDWYDRMIKPFQGKLYGYGSVHVQATGSDYEISGDTLPTSALEAIDLVSTNSATWDTVSSKQPSGDYYSASNPSGFITDVPAGTMNESGFEYSGSSITAYNGSAFKAGDEFPQSATEAINVVTGNSANWNNVSSKLDTTAFSTVSGDFITALPSDLATTGDIADLAESISETYQPKGDYLTTGDSANFYTTANPSGFITGVDLTPYQTTAGMTAYQPVGDYYSASNPSGFLTAETDWTNTITAASSYAYEQATAAIPAPQDLSYISGQVDSKLPTTAFSTVSGSFLTAHQSLPNSANWDSTYTTVNLNSGSWSGRPQIPISGINIDIYESDGKVVFSGMTGGGSTYTGDVQGALNEVYSNSADWNSAAAMVELPVSAGQGMDIQNVDGNIVFSCTGGSVPEGVLVESGLEYNAVNEISGYSGSAFAQYGAEKQWLQHDDTLLHVANSAQYALGVNVSAVAQLLGIDETVLWSGTGITTAFTLSEAATGFNKIRYEWRWNNSVNNATINSVFNPDTQIFNLYAMNAVNNNKYYTIGNFTYDTAYKNITYVSGWQAANNVVNTATNIERFISIHKIVGIGRKA